MSISPELEDLKHVKVEPVKHKRRNTHSTVSYDAGVKGGPKVSSISSDFVYLNSAYVGSLNSVNEVRRNEPPTSVYREQYWACSKWSFTTKRVLSVVVGIILGGAIGLAVTLSLKEEPSDGIRGIFRSSAPD